MRPLRGKLCAALAFLHSSCLTMKASESKKMTNFRGPMTYLLTQVISSSSAIVTLTSVEFIGVAVLAYVIAQMRRYSELEVTVCTEPAVYRQRVDMRAVYSGVKMPDAS